MWVIARCCLTCSTKSMNRSNSSRPMGRMIPGRFMLTYSNGVFGPQSHPARRPASVSERTLKSHSSPAMRRYAPLRPSGHGSLSALPGADSDDPARHAAELRCGRIRVDPQEISRRRDDLCNKARVGLAEDDYTRGFV